jgi:hypothetical protein
MVLGTHPPRFNLTSHSTRLSGRRHFGQSAARAFKPLVAERFDASLIAAAAKFFIVEEK